MASCQSGSNGGGEGLLDSKILGKRGHGNFWVSWMWSVRAREHSELPPSLGD